ncbi:MAG TPA: protein-tyrosine-phosphatase [Pelobium sp.]|nr:protein-tyrosine-phosphatase [Pelobium sp.]
MLNELTKTISTLNPESISTERIEKLKPLIDFVQNKVSSKQQIRLNFICTHNSRRSHLSQVWAQTLAHHFNLNNVFCYSGGTEATAVFPQAIEALKSAGFKVNQLSEAQNPVYSIKYAINQHPVIAFSKKYEDDFNPSADFAAILTCTEADGACPFIAGAEKRIALPFEDPKAFDKTPQKAEKYKERSFQIATELFYVFSQIKSHIHL